MNSVRFIQQFEPMELEYPESDRLDAKVARAFHKNIPLITYKSSTTYSTSSPTTSVTSTARSATVASTASASAPETSAPAAPAPETSAPAASAPETSTPAASAPETSAPAASAPETFAPAASASATPATSGLHKRKFATTIQSDTTYTPIVRLNTQPTPIRHAVSLASTYPLVLESQKIMIDAQMVMIYWKQGLEVPFGRKQAKQMRASVESAIAELGKVFPPPRPKDSDVRHQHFEKALQRHGVGNCGVYHFARWVATNRSEKSCPFA
ncbi:hypothetical protein L211DRAFT_901738 [Terfezia boudieri ATCC MYA-4762]|uniref:Uncharacterized protein n=1 Tax=Terfezia boudieri ATCC MYA-4762 TaxID=1051890 RepID=A0A3N4LB04_9PEZI|nr:hypothetical protein L211DRAFT_901738 [Terfezia boudieri ATCC MYA-4762]